jgi:hypothetical protein
MLENKRGDYERKEKLICLHCGNSNLSIPEIKPIKEQKLGLNWLLSLGLTRTFYLAFYHCTDCNQVSVYPILYCDDANQNSTTKLNTRILDSTQKIDKVKFN